MLAAIPGLQSTVRVVDNNVFIDERQKLGKVFWGLAGSESQPYNRDVAYDPFSALLRLKFRLFYPTRGRQIAAPSMSGGSVDSRAIQTYTYAAQSR